MSTATSSELSQPSQNDAYTTSGNPVTQEPAESRIADRKEEVSKTASAVETRVPQQQASQEEATPSSLAAGIHGAASGEEARGQTTEDVGRHRELDAQQMAAPGEGRVYNAVQEKPGASGSQPDLASDLDRKKAEQAPLRDAIKGEKDKKVDVGGILGQRGGPASTVD